MGKQQTVTVAGHRLKLSNLDKILFPDSDTTKAEVIEYFQSVVPAMLPHIAGRPVTRKRWPDGVGPADSPKEAFFRKNLEDSSPAWVPRLALQHSDHVNVYPVVESEAELAWFGQVAALELHVPQWRFEGDPQQPGKTEPSPTAPRNPDRLVLDLDPGPGTGLADCAQVARWCREILDAMALPSIPVTSGSKGLHLYAALDGSYTSEQVSEVTKELAKALEKDHPDEVVSAMKKSQRKGKVFIDWSQNHWNKTTVAPYSLRGRAGSANGPYVAAPRTWEELQDPELAHLDSRQVMERLADGFDPLEDFGAPVWTTEASATEDRLSTYRSLRDAAKTPEPVPQASPAERGEDPLFVIQEHHASSLHYDTRLEHDGVLVSWAAPKAPPLTQGTQRLAVQTEDHPVEYAAFEGSIPKGEYGGGQVSIWDSGTVDIEKWEEGKVVFTLHGRPDGGLGGRPRRYVLIRTGDDGKQWLIRLMKRQPKESDLSTTKRRAKPKGRQKLLEIPSPMLTTLGEPSDIRGQGWTFEAKWDGYRVLARVDADGIALRSRNGKDLTDTFPELAELAGCAPDGTVLDGEVVALNSNNRPDFGLLQKRGRLTKKRETDNAASKTPVHYMLFDVLHTAEHGDLTEEPYSERRKILQKLVDEGQHIQVPGGLGDSLEEALEVSEQLKLEGILCKRTDSAYLPGRRSEDWVKIKHQNHADVTIIGWRQGNGSRRNTFGSLLLAMPDESGNLSYAGRVGTGFSDADLKDLRTQLERLVRKTPPVDDVPGQDASDATWVTPKLHAEVRHSGLTRDSRLRHPTWRAAKP